MTWTVTRDGEESSLDEAEASVSKETLAERLQECKPFALDVGGVVFEFNPDGF